MIYKVQHGFLFKHDKFKGIYFIFDFRKLKISSIDCKLTPFDNVLSNFSKKKSISLLFIIKAGDTNKWFEFQESLTAAKILSFSYKPYPYNAQLSII